MDLTSLVKKVSAQDKLSKTSFYFEDSQRVDLFHSFLRRLEEAVSDQPVASKLDLLLHAVGNFTRAQIERGVEAYEESWAELHAPQTAREAVDVVQSPFKPDREYTVRRNLAAELGLDRDWQGLKVAILRSVLGQDGLAAAEKNLESVKPLDGFHDISRHNYQFRTLVSNYRDLRGDRGPRWLVDRYLRTVPTEVRRSLPNIPESLDATMESVEALCLRWQRLGALQGHTPSPGVCSIKQGPSASSSPHRDLVSSTLAHLQSADRAGLLAEEAVKLVGHHPCQNAIASMTTNEYVALRKAAYSSPSTHGSSQALVASINQLLPKSWKRTSRHVTETTGEWDLTSFDSKDELAKAYALNRYVAGLKRTSPPDDEEEEEEEPPPPPKRVRRSAAAAVAQPPTEDVWKAGFAIRDVLAVLSSPKIVCHHCAGPHLVRVCPELKRKDGQYDPFCTYCGKVGHKVGELRDPICPVLKVTICPACQKAGHTFDFCPLNTCIKCKGTGHTSLVCRNRQPGAY